MTMLIDNKTGLKCRECGEAAHVSTDLSNHYLYCLNCAYELDLITVSVKEDSTRSRIAKYLELMEEEGTLPSRSRCTGGRMCYCAPFEEADDDSR
jgi:hypothetical protein